MLQVSLCHYCIHTFGVVDRVLLGLLNEGFTEFVRVGSLKKIAKPLLNYTLQSVDGITFLTALISGQIRRQ